jgi:signal transduction histidine kinase
VVKGETKPRIVAAGAPVPGFSRAWGDVCQEASTDNAPMRRVSFTAWLTACLTACLWLLVMPSRAWAMEAQHMGQAAHLSPASHPPIVMGPDESAVVREACVLQDHGALTPPMDDAPWLRTTLPHLWRDTHPGLEGTLWYRFRIHMDTVPTKPWAVYLPRVVMNAQVWINGQPMGYTGSMVEPVSRNWYVPLLTSVQPAVWIKGDNVVHIRVASGFVSRNGLSPVEIGPLDQLATAYKHRKWAQVDGVEVANTVLLSLGMFMLLVWLRDREQTAIGFLGLSAITWALSAMMGIAPTPLFESYIWENLGYTLSVVSQLLFCLYFFRFAQFRHVWVDGLVYLLMVVIPVYGVVGPLYWMNTVLYGVIYLLALWSMGMAVWHVLRHRRKDGIWLLVGCLTLLPSGAHDVMIRTGSLPFDSIYWLYFAGPTTMLCMAVIVAGDHARSRLALNDLNRHLADRVAEREQALRASFERLASLERAQAVSAERSRILKDMHDGVGAHLTSALRQLQTPRLIPVDVPLVTQTLRDSLDQLKLSIDALSLQAGDVEGLLASWRFRLAPRLKAAGIELVWDVERLPIWPQGHSPELRQLQYILFEGLSNVLQHSGATRLVLSARDLGHHIRVSLIDNGQGWQGTGQYEGQGLQTMRSRAQTIGATMAFLPASNGGLELRLSLPLIIDLQADQPFESQNDPSKAA